MDNSKVELLGGRFFFKIDRRTDNLVLLFATNLSVTPDNNTAHSACIGSTNEVKIKAWRVVNLTTESSFDIL